MLNAIKFSELLSHLVLLYNSSFQHIVKLYFFPLLTVCKQIAVCAREVHSHLLGHFS